MRIYVVLFLLATPVLLWSQSVKPAKKKILMVVSSYGKKAGKQRPGFEFDEYSQAWLIFKKNGLEIDVASPKGGSAEPDEYNKTKVYNKEILADTPAMLALQNTIPTALVKAEQYDAVYIVGGKGAMFDLPFDPSLQEIITRVYQKPDGIISAVCHGPAALVHVKLNDSTYLIANKSLTGFCNDEEVKFGKTWKTEFPFLLEDKLKARGVRYESSEAMLPQVTIDGRLITGQNPYSTIPLAEAVVKALNISPAKREPYKDERSMQLVKKALKGEMQWAQEEIKNSNALYDLQLIAVYGYYKLLYAKGDKNELTKGLAIIELVTPWFFNPDLYLEMAKGYQQLNNKEKAKTILQEILKKQPAFTDAQKLLDEIK